MAPWGDQMISWHTKPEVKAGKKDSKCSKSHASNLPSTTMIPPVVNPVIPLTLSAQETEATESIQALRNLLHKHLRISIADGRVLLGTFIGTDQKLNLLLGDAEEFRLLGVESQEDSDEREHVWDGVLREGMCLESLQGRYVGQVLVPWKQAVRVEAYDPQKNQRQKNDGMYL
ncbi:lsm domain-containing protein [Moniliophthora roreri]|nr:lsm domain-containing protein [Moniliophthora roreri]